MASDDTANRQRLSEDKIDRVEHHLVAARLSPVRLTGEEIDRHYSESGVAVGWRIELDEQHKVDVLLSADYPYRRAQIGVAPLRRDRPFSRVFVDETLCLMKANEAHALNDDERVLDELIRRTRELLQQEPGDERERNAEEIVDYWKGGRCRSPIVSIINVDANPREVFYSVGHPFTVVGDSRSAIESWIWNFSGVKAAVRKSVFVTADVGFPVGAANGRALYDYFEEHRPDQIPLLNTLATGDPMAAPVLIGILDVTQGIALLGCWITRPKGQKVGKPRPSITPGFRPGKAPGYVAAPYFFSAESSLEKVRVHRADAVWLTARGGNGSADSIRASRVVLVGCGSLGSSIARLIAKAGVSEIVLIDPDLLAWGNISRHELGARYVQRSKAKALAETISRDFPHVRATPYFETWQQVYAREPVLFLQASVIVSTTGHPSSDIQLSDVAVAANTLPPLIFGWLEPFAAAARALVVVGDGCLRCGCDEFGIFRNRVTEWTNPTERFEPGCSISWQPYSEIAAMPAKSFLGAILLDTIKTRPYKSTLHTWVGPESLRNDNSGRLTSEWLAVHGEPPAYGATYVDAWFICAGGCKRVA